MKYNIFNPKPKPVPEPEVTMDLQLESFGGGVRVVCVNPQGVRVNRGVLATFTTAGKVHLEENVNPSLGFRLDWNGAITLASSKD